MTIAVLNECFLQKDHVARLRRLGKVTMYKSTLSEHDAVKRLQGIEVAAIHCSLLPISATILQQTASLKYISLASTGYDRVDIHAARSRNIIISNLPTYGTESVAEFTFALIFAVIRKVVVLDRLFRKTPFEINSIDKLTESPYIGENLRGMTLGIIGLGRIGSRVAEIGKAIGMKVVAYDIVSKSMKGVQMVSLNKLLQNSDIVSIHAPLTNETEGMIDEQALSLMKRSAILINTARGKIVQTKVLAKSLRNNKIAGAGIDTVTELNSTNPLLTFKNVVLSPHTGWYTRESFTNISCGVVANIEAYVKSMPINVIT